MNVIAFTPEESYSRLRYVLITAEILAIATGIGWLFRLIQFPETNIVIVYLLSILIVARFTRGYAYGLAASVIATGAFNYFFTIPYYTLSVNDPSYLVTFAIMTITAFITSALTSKVKQSALQAREKEAETSAVYQLTNRLTDAADLSEIAGITIDAISGVLDCRAAFLCFDEHGQPESSFLQQQSQGRQVRRSLDDQADFRHRMEGLRTAYDVGEEFCDWPIYGRETILGMLRIPKQTVFAMSEPHKRLLHSMIESAALAMDRFHSAQAQLRSREETVQERYRANLLRAISHDLRTPLSGLMGTAEMLMDMTDPEDPRYALAQDMHRDADWLHALVENILSLTRLQEGKLTLAKQPEAAEEVIGGAVDHVTKRHPNREILADIPDEVLIVPMDAKLIEQVLINLLDNALQHTPPEREVRVSVRPENGYAVFSVIDQGRGIAAADLPNIFKMFYTTHAREADARRGVGLGLTICEAIVKAHGGTIEGHNRSDGPGAAFIFTLPMEEQQHGT